ncbi:YkgJ family cysteine cluster protein [Pseudomonas sp. gcc21]|uniref:YkgJ family cysteine cluster protein n=1 Tax=Pseudomonas sp. gcc21 TaxID=2726989 RepID=UPI0014513A02|nr:YkgJ family cysteine cluster protein [Pseudomonas sp. gcc21]QJD57932.1 YkgJ family cysteine cluster protein [Pseudomonas sp. gcc21]
MKCREGCGACCIAPSISSPIPGMPEGKPAGVACINLTPDNRCGIFTSPLRPPVCSQFAADPQVCGENADEALMILRWWEQQTA